MKAFCIYWTRSGPRRHGNAFVVANDRQEAIRFFLEFWRYSHPGDPVEVTTVEPLEHADVRMGSEPERR